MARVLAGPSGSLFAEGTHEVRCARSEEKKKSIPGVEPSGSGIVCLYVGVHSCVHGLYVTSSSSPASLIAFSLISASLSLPPLPPSLFLSALNHSSLSSLSLSSYLSCCSGNLSAAVVSS